MKRKAVVFIIAVSLLAIMCMSLVACDNATNFRFSEDMTADEIVDAINNLKSLTLESAVYHIGPDNEVYILRNNVNYYGEKINNICGRDDLTGLSDNDIREYVFYEDGVYYYFRQGSPTYKKRRMSEEQYNSTYRFHVVDYVFFNNFLQEGDYEIIDGNLYVGKLANTGKWAYIIRDMNKTKVKLPSEFSDYKTREFTD